MLSTRIGDKPLPEPVMTQISRSLPNLLRLCKYAMTCHSWVRIGPMLAASGRFWPSHGMYTSCAFRWRNNSRWTEIGYFCRQRGTWTFNNGGSSRNPPRTASCGILRAWNGNWSACAGNSRLRLLSPHVSSKDTFLDSFKIRTLLNFILWCQTEP